MSTTRQQDPVTSYCRPIADIMEQVRGIIAELGTSAEVYTGTNLDDLSKRVSGALARNGASPVAIVCYGGSDFGNSPRRTSRINVVVVSADTRVRPGIPGALECAWGIEGAIDRLISEDVVGECPQTCLFEVDGEEPVQLKDCGASCAVVVSVIVKDY